MNDIFFSDPWWLVLIKVLILFVLLLVWTIFNVWYERRLVGKMQHRLGPIMNGPLGLGQAVADGTKALLKEDFRPTKADPIVFNLAPILTAVAAFTTWTVIPFGGEVTMFGHQTRLQLTDLPVSVLFILAIASIGIYGIVLAGWASNSTYSLLGSLRSSAQMISYEVAMGLSLVGVFMFSGSMSTFGIVEAQAAPIGGTIFSGWYALLLIPSFIIYCISMVGETNRAPFDLPECESELVSGYITEYSGFRYALYFLAEYINMATVSAVATTLFLGGYRPPWSTVMDNWLMGTPAAFLTNPWWGPLWFMIKVQLLISVFVWLRGTLPRFRYDQFMDLGWKKLIPISLYWIMGIALVRYGIGAGWFANTTVLIVIGVVILAMLVYAFWPQKTQEETAAPVQFDPAEPFDPFAGGYPVPPRPGQRLPELAGVVSSTSAATEESTTEGADS